MAEDQDQAQSKTEAPTPRRREEARKKGQVAYSSDLGSSCVLLAGTTAFWLGGSSLGQNLVTTFRTALTDIDRKEIDIDAASVMAMSFFESLLHVTGLVLGLAALGGFAVGALQAGIRFTTDPLQPNLNRLSPISGWQRLWSSRSAVRAVAAVLKVMALGAVAWWIIYYQAIPIAISGRSSLVAAVSRGWNVTIQIALAASAALVLIGMLDYLFQRWKHEEDLKMSRHELKEEHKQEEGDPHVKARIKRLQREAAQSRMLQDVEDATVIVTNPTHFAVALRYDHEMVAPKVVAKGSDLFARRIIRVAESHDVPILRRPPLARALFAAVEVGQEIPPVLYKAIAEILSHVFRLRGAA